MELKNSNLTEEETKNLLNQKVPSVPVESVNLGNSEPTKSEPTVPTITVAEDGVKSLGKVDLSKPKFDMPDVGWKSLPVEILPTGGSFYPTDMKIHIKAASTKDIRHYSTIEPEDYLDVDDKLNYIVDSCSQITMNGTRASYKDLVEIDRLFVIVSIRDLTFKEGENKLQMNVNCKDCGNVDTIELNRDRLRFFKLDSIIEKYYNEEERCFKFRTDSGDSWNLYLPTLGITTFIKNNTRAKVQKGDFVDRFFLKYAPFLFGDWRKLTERNYKSAEEDTFGWSPLKIKIMKDLVDSLSKSVNPVVNHICTSCGSEVEQPISFQGGVESLLLPTDGLSKLA